MWLYVKQEKQAKCTFIAIFRRLRPFAVACSLTEAIYSFITTSSPTLKPARRGFLFWILSLAQCASLMPPYANAASDSRSTIRMPSACHASVVTSNVRTLYKISRMKNVKCYYPRSKIYWWRLHVIQQILLKKQLSWVGSKLGSWQEVEQYIYETEAKLNTDKIKKSTSVFCGLYFYRLYDAEINFPKPKWNNSSAAHGFTANVWPLYGVILWSIRVHPTENWRRLVINNFSYSIWKQYEQNLLYCWFF